jgi:Flagellar transcriptional activator (FlhD)
MCHVEQIEGESMAEQVITVVPDAKQLSLTYLLVLQTTILKDPAQATYVFGIDAATALIIRDKSYQDLQSLAYGQDRFLATLSYSARDLAELLSQPPPLHRILAAVRHEPTPTNNSADHTPRVLSRSTSPGGGQQ